MIKHIVIAGGSSSGITVFGILKKLHNYNIYDMKNIETIWGTSAGSMIAVILCLQLEWETMYTYICDRPWEKLLTIHPSYILESISRKGIFSSTDLITKFFIPLFKTKDLDIDITLQQFYEFTNIKLVMYSSAVKDLTSVQLSHETYPNMRVLTAISMSIAIPFLFQPVFYENTYYCDGGLVNNFPITNCVHYLKKQNKTDEEINSSVLGISGKLQNNSENDKSNNENITERDTIFDYFVHLIYRMIYNSQFTRQVNDKSENLPFIVTFPDIQLNFSKLKDVIYKEKRTELLLLGEKACDKFIEKNKEACENLLNISVYQNLII